jgi:ribosomal RNA-processing protein 9
VVAVQSLAFRKGTQQLYSGSFDRTLRLHDLSVMGYVETLFGHQDTVLSMDALRSETVVSVGARDKSVRFWKIVDESQLVFRGGSRSAVRELLDGGALEGLQEEKDDDGDDGTMGTRGKKGKERASPKKFVEGSIECVAMIDEVTFVSGGDSG